MRVRLPVKQTRAQTPRRVTRVLGPERLARRLQLPPHTIVTLLWGEEVSVDPGVLEGEAVKHDYVEPTVHAAEHKDLQGDRCGERPLPVRVPDDVGHHKGGLEGLLQRPPFRVGRLSGGAARVEVGPAARNHEDLAGVLLQRGAEVEHDHLASQAVGRPHGVQNLGVAAHEEDPKPASPLGEVVEELLHEPHEVKMLSTERHVEQRIAV
mmetsp:Transcript_1092/g.2491  ORF Transcript_1092/g.2491 Transcript_1092/m.2491 type:complete len:209 (-) Transcript_1092:470-1096(-)